MCGLVGCVGSISRKEEDAFALLLQLDTVRGPHSTGVAFIHFKDEPIIAKSEGTPWELIRTDEWRRGMGRANAALLGHNRFATRGAVSEENAHPFQHSHIIGAHNGTLTRQSLLKDYTKFEVDSDNLYYDMAESGYKSTIKRLDGAFALSWYDSFNETINLCRNSQRPLHYVFTKDNKTVFWASEAWMLGVALGRSNIDHFDIRELAVAEHVEFPLPDVWPSQVKAIKEYKSEKVELIPPYQPYQYNYHNGGNSERKNEGSGSTPSVTNTNNSKGSSSTDGSAKPLPDGLTFPALLTAYREKGTIEFFVAEEVRKPDSKHTPPHIKGYTQDKHGVEVRIHQEPGSPVWNKLAKSADWFRGKIRTTSITGVNSGHITIDPRSLVELAYADLSPEGKLEWDKIKSTPKTEETAYKGFNNAPLTADAYLQLTNEGCMACNEIASFADNNLIIWVGPKNYLCKKCKHDPELIAMAKEDVANPRTVH